MIRVIQVGLGPLGLKLAEEFLARGAGRIVAAVDPSPELCGRALNELVPAAEAGVQVLGAVAEIRNWSEIDAAFVTTSSLLEACMETFRELLKHRIAVVSSCEELLYPWLRNPIHAQELHQRCVRNGGRLLGTGVNPGFLMDTLPVTLSAASHTIERVDVWRIQDARPRRIPFQRKIGAGKSRSEFDAAVAAGTLRHAGLLESLHFVAHYLGIELDTWDESIEPVISAREIECDLGTIAAGEAAGVEQVASGWQAGELRVQLTFRAAIDEPDPFDRIHIQGEPNLDLKLKGGVHGDIATIALLIHSLRALRSVPAGLHTMATIPPPHYFAPKGTKR